MWEKWEGWSRINIKKHNLVKTNYTVLFGFLTTNRFYHGKNTCMIIQWWLQRQLLPAFLPPEKTIYN